MHILYSSYGFWLSLGYEDVKPDANVISVVFFPVDQGAIDFAEVIGSFEPEWLLPWQGYQEFEFYCRDAYDGKVCQEEH